MNRRGHRGMLLRVVLASAALLTSTAGSVALLSSPSFAGTYTPPPWEPDAYQNADGATGYGNLVFYDANGDQITSGTNLSDPWAYIGGTTPFPQGSAVKVTGVYFALPNPAEVTGAWTTDKEASSSSPTLPGTAPADLQALDSAYPVLAPAGADLSTYITSVGTGFSTAPGYANLMQVRVVPDDFVSHSNGPYYEADIAFNTGSSPITVDGTVSVPADGWAEVYPAVTQVQPTLAATQTGTVAAGTAESLTATVPSGDVGSINFYDGTTLLGNVPLTSGTGDRTATYPTTGTYTPAIGSHSFTALFVPGTSSTTAGQGPGDENGVGTADAAILGGDTPSAAVPLTVQNAATATTTALSLSPNPSVSGQTVVYTATVSPAPSGGTVSFSSNGTDIATCSGTNAVAVNTTTGEATCTLTPGPDAVGSPYTIEAVYSGNTGFAGSTAPTMSQVVGKADSATALVSSANPGGSGQSITLTATVSATGLGTGTPTGTVEFESGGSAITAPNNCSAVTASAGVATCMTTFTASSTLTAVYSGDTNFDGSTSPNLDETIYPATSTAVTSSDSSPVFDQPITYTATVTPTPTGGTVSFTSDGTAIAACSGANAVAVSITTGEAPCDTTVTSAPTQDIVATYNPGTAHFGESTSPPFDEAVDPATTSTAVTSSQPSPVTGQAVTFTATISVTSDAGSPGGTAKFEDDGTLISGVTSGAGSPGGTVKFEDDGTLISGCSAEPVSTSTDTATCATTLLASNGSPQSITAIFTSSNTAEFSDSTSLGFPQAVNPASTKTVVTSSLNPAFTGQTITYTATVSAQPPGAGTPGGDVEFFDGGPASPIITCENQPLTDGKATCSASYATTGSQTISAEYLGSPNYAESTSANLSETIVTAVAPGPPTGLTATSGQSQVVLSWTAPTSNGGSPIRGYDVYVGTSSGGESTTPVNTSLVTVTTYTVTGLTNGIRYYFVVKAVNAVGSSGPSNEVSAVPTRLGYWLVGSDGAVYIFDAPFHGSLDDVHLDAPIVGMAATPDDGGYWLVGADGGVFAFGNAGFFGSLGDVHLNAPIVGIVATPNGGGYWLVARDGGVFAFGNARYYGSLGDVHLNAPIVGMTATTDGGGYWLVGADGGVFSFGNAGFHGSLGNIHLNAPIVGIAATLDGGGYWLVGSDGGVFTFGDGVFHGSLGDIALTAPIAGIVATHDGGGYWLIGLDGGVFSLGDASYFGSVPGLGIFVRDIEGGAT
jgi:hypothetical protein